MTQNTFNLTAAQEREIIFKLNQMLNDGRYTKMIFAIAHAGKCFIQKLPEGEPACAPAFAEGCDSILLLLEASLPVTVE